MWQVNLNTEGTPTQEEHFAIYAHGAGPSFRARKMSAWLVMNMPETGVPEMLESLVGLLCFYRDEPIALLPEPQVREVQARITG